MTLLKRLGNKQAIAKDIYPLFPKHDMYIELFFGAGGMFFRKPKVKHNIMNDIDGDIYNLFNVLKTRKDELVEAMIITPIHDKLWDNWKAKQEDDDIWKAVRFLYLSNLGFMGQPATMVVGTRDRWSFTINLIEKTYEKIKAVQFLCDDYRKVLDRLEYANSIPFIYADPPYINTGSNYTHDDWTEEDSIELFDVLCNSGYNFAMSEFDNDFIVKEAKGRGLIITDIGSRQNLRKRRNEILITNYQIQRTLF